MKNDVQLNMNISFLMWQRYKKVFLRTLSKLWQSGRTLLEELNYGGP